MNTRTIVVAVAAMSACIVACTAEENGSATLNDAKAELKALAKESVIQEDLDEPDGVSAHVNADGTFQVFGRGTGSYDFNDTDDINDARKVATLKAKAAIAKYINETLSTEEGLAEATTKTKNLASDKSGESGSATKETIKQTSEVIKNKATVLLKGAVVLEDEKIPNASGNGGRYRVTVGISSKSLGAVTTITKAIDLAGEQGDFSAQRKKATGAEPAEKESEKSSADATEKSGFTGNDSNKYEKRRSKTDF